MRALSVCALLIVVAALPLAAQQPCAAQQEHMAAMHKDHDAMMARMDSVDQVLAQQVATLKTARGSDRTARLEAVVLTLASSHLSMHEHMKEMMGGMGGMGGMGCAQPADSAKQQHQH
jgi:hypothetical protein